ncbi:hypothetical protein ARMGADRAFT_1084076 [Armillaria gallica]|uniref:Uncharacterized protein n=1 Tax=Armillaria gallica TaxID=47427 RepID=A0A2H3DC31_ARMGA|nr:hypothetical protein ARMGADRAFT_1084076 [Armillaria gallica]
MMTVSERMSNRFPTNAVVDWQYNVFELHSSPPPKEITSNSDVTELTTIFNQSVDTMEALTNAVSDGYLPILDASIIVGITDIGRNRITSSGGSYAIMSDYGDDYGFDDYASCLIWGRDVTAGFEEAFRRRLRLKQRAHNRSHNRGIIAYSDPPNGSSVVQCCAGRATVTEVTTVTEPWPSLS